MYVHVFFLGGVVWSVPLQGCFLIEMGLYLQLRARFEPSDNCAQLLGLAPLFTSLSPTESHLHGQGRQSGRHGENSKAIFIGAPGTALRSRPSPGMEGQGDAPLWSLVGQRKVQTFLSLSLLDKKSLGTELGAQCGTPPGSASGLCAPELVAPGLLGLRSRWVCTAAPCGVPGSLRSWMCPSAGLGLRFHTGRLPTPGWALMPGGLCPGTSGKPCSPGGSQIWSSAGGEKLRERKEERRGREAREGKEGRREERGKERESKKEENERRK